MSNQRRNNKNKNRKIIGKFNHVEDVKKEVLEDEAKDINKASKKEFFSVKKNIEDLKKFYEIAKYPTGIYSFFKAVFEFAKLISKIFFPRLEKNSKARAATLAFLLYIIYFFMS